MRLQNSRPAPTTITLAGMFEKDVGGITSRRKVQKRESRNEGDAVVDNGSYGNVGTEAEGDLSTCASNCTCGEGTSMRPRLPMLT
jgi:hypothetical protein